MIKGNVLHASKDTIWLMECAAFLTLIMINLLMKDAQNGIGIIKFVFNALKAILLKL